MSPHRFESHNRDSLIDQERSAEQPAEDIIARAEIGSDGIVADLGCGNGYLAVPLSRKAGLVLALDVSHEMLRDLMEEMRWGLQARRSCRSVANCPNCL